MAYVHGNPTTAELFFIASEDVAKPGQIAIYVDDSHDIITGGRPLSHWRLTSLGDDVEINLDAVKAHKIACLTKEANEYVDKYYNLKTQVVLLMLLSEAMMMSYTNRIGYLTPAMSWGLSIILYNKTKEAEIEALATVQAVDAFTWGFDQFTGSNPLVTISQAAQITD